MERGVIYYIAENENLVAGCVALEPVNSNVCYLERLAVLSDQRRRDFGKKLVNHVLSKAKTLGTQRVNIGIITEQTELKIWYGRIGFIETDSKKFARFPIPSFFNYYLFIIPFSPY